MPLYAAGAGETLTPFSLAGVIPPLTFVWSVNSRQVAQLKSAFHTVCVHGIIYISVTLLALLVCLLP